MTKESRRAIASLMALIQTTENADIIHSLRYAIEAIHRAEKYQDMKARLNRIYGDCDNLLEVAVQGLCRHPGAEIGTPIKARLLTDEDADAWEAYRALGTVEEIQNMKQNLETAYHVIREYETKNHKEESS